MLASASAVVMGSMRGLSQVLFTSVFTLFSVACGSGSETGGAGGSAGSGQGSCGPSTAQLLATGEVPHTIAVNSTHVFWTDVKWVGGNGEAVVRMVPKAGGAVSELYLEAGARFYAIAANDQAVYFTSEVMNYPSSGRILKAPTQTQEAPSEFAVD